jgi:hypothetical protein
MRFKIYRNLDQKTKNTDPLLCSLTFNLSVDYRKGIRLCVNTHKQKISVLVNIENDRLPNSPYLKVPLSDLA